MKWAARVKYILMALALIGGIGVACYPAVSNWLNTRFAFQVIGDYQEAVSRMTDEEIERKKQAARTYNDTLPNGGDYEAYGDENQSSISVLSVGEILGYIEIPKINVNLPIYEGTSPEVLQKGVGHLKNTSLPVGGSGTHVGLSAHRGLSAAKLFTDLDKIEKGDYFYLKVLDETLAYEVDQIQVTEPYISHELDIQEGQDYVTLITCTPYGINSHRLLVRGKRIPYESFIAETMDEEEVLESEPSHLRVIRIILCMAEMLLIEARIILQLFRKKDKRQKRSGL